MSKFVDKLERVYRTSEPAIGFKRAGSASLNQPLVLVASLPQAKAEIAKIVADSGVDAGLIAGKDFTVKNLKQLITVMGDIPLGVSVEGMGQEEIAGFVGSGCDFVVFNLRTPVATLESEEIGKVLEVRYSLDQGLVRAINGLQLPVDAVLITGEVDEPFITVERLLICQRFAGLLDKPLLITLPFPITASELSSLWRDGVNGVVVSSEHPVEILAELRKAIDSLPQGGRQQFRRRAAVLPHLGTEMGVSAEEEEEEDEDI